MKKIVQLAGIFVLLVGVSFFLINSEKQVAYLSVNENMQLVLLLKTNEEKELLKPWFNKRDGLYYFFLPSFVGNNRVRCDNINADIFLEGERLLKGRSFQWEKGKVYNLICGENEYKIVFMKSANVPALFVETESGTMANLNADKELVETGSVSLIKETRNVEYRGALKKISARGNSTFDNKDKKAYSFTLNDSYPLCGMDAGKKWNLLAMYFEYDKIHTKLVYDMAKTLDMEYNIDCTWVDLYCNGEYQGLYLLTEAVTVGEGRVDIRNQEKTESNNGDISGGYLMEKDVMVHLEEEGNGFVTEKLEYPFILKNPIPASEEQMNYVKSYIQYIEDLLVAGDKEYKKYVDLDSFAKQFLIDKIVLEPDAMNMSTFYYKEADSDVLKVGPLWDYDRAFGGAVPNYMLSIGDFPDSMHGWYMELYRDEEFKEKMTSYYRELLPILKEMLETGIDEYAGFVSESVKMDAAKWSNENYQTDMMGYLSYESNVRYLKYFLANRLNYLNEVWEISGWQFEVPESTGMEHTVQLVMDDGTLLESRKVTDGNSVGGLPELDKEKYSGWTMNDGGKVYSSYLPVYEDLVLNAQREFENLDERMTYKIEKLHNASELLDYMKVLEDNDFSVCISLDGSSELVKRKEVLSGVKEICDYKHPEWLDKELGQKDNYFLLIDNGWQQIWDGTYENLTKLNTTFGPLTYEEDLEGKASLYIQDGERNYLDSETRGGITFVVVNRFTGGIVDVRAFD